MLSKGNRYCLLWNSPILTETKDRTFLVCLLVPRRTVASKWEALEFPMNKNKMAKAQVFKGL